MPAYFDTGFSVREPMWHRGGKIADDYPESWEAAREWAGLMWEPELVDAGYMRRLPADFRCPVCGVGIGELHTAECIDTGTLPAEVYTNANGTRLVIRNDDGRVLGPVTDKFGLVPHKAMGEIIEAVLESEKGKVKFETAGSCGKVPGQQVWALAYLDEPVAVAGDDTETYPFLAFLNNHDGGGAAKLTFTNVRVVCWNTYNAASMQGERSGNQFVFRHSANVMERIEEAKNALRGLRDSAAEWVKLAAELNLLRVDVDAINDFTIRFLPEPPAGTFSKLVAANIARDRSSFKLLHDTSATTEGHRGTVLGLVDAAVEYLDHVRGYQNRDTYLRRTLLRPEPLKASALKLALEVAGVSAN